MDIFDTAKGIFMGGCLCLSAMFLQSCGGGEGIAVKQGVDIKRYMGRWYEIARFENWFERGKFDARADYELLENGRVRVVNSSTDAKGMRSSAKGEAYVPDSSVPAKLRVSFFKPFYGDYWILELSEDYSRVLVGGRDKDYLWILARSPSLSRKELDEFVSLARAHKYDTSKFLYNSDLRKTIPEQTSPK